MYFDIQFCNKYLSSIQYNLNQLYARLKLLSVRTAQNWRYFSLILNSTCFLTNTCKYNIARSVAHEMSLAWFGGATFFKLQLSHKLPVVQSFETELGLLIQLIGLVF